MKPMRSQSEIEPNPVNLPDRSVHELLEPLDQHVSSLFTLFHQYQKHHWLVEGPQFLRLHEFLEQAYTELHEDIDRLAERMTVLGLTPTCAPSRQQENSYIEHEPEGAFRVRDMLARDLEAEGTAAEKLRHTIQRADSVQDYGTGHLLKQILVRCEDRAHHLEHYLADDSLAQTGEVAVVRGQA